VILLPWLALLASLAYQHVRAGAGRWFWRICSVEAIILLVFGHWYSWRYPQTDQQKDGRINLFCNPEGEI
jgi:hypothetical protein